MIDIRPYCYVMLGYECKHILHLRTYKATRDVNVPEAYLVWLL